MASSREKFFKGQVLKALYQDEEESSDEETRKKSFENLEKLKQAVKRKVLEQPELDKRTGDSDWPVPLPKLKKVYTVSVNPEDLNQSVNSKIQGRDTSTSPGTSSNQQTQDSNSSAKTEAKLSKNKRRKLKKKRRQKEKEQEQSQEFTY